MGLLLALAWRNTLRCRWAVAGLALVIAILVTALAGRSRTRATILHTLETLTQRLQLADLDVRVVGTPRDVALACCRTDRVADLEARLVRRGTLGGPDLPALPAVVYALPAKAPRLHRVEIQEGRYPLPGEASLVVDRSLRALHDVRLGQSLLVSIEDQRLRLPVVGIALFADHLMTPTHPDYAVPVRGTLGVVGLSHAAARELPHADRVTSVLLRLTDGASAAEVAATLPHDDRMQVEHVVLRSERPDHLVLHVLLHAYDLYAPAVLLMLTCVGLLLVVIALSHLVHQQREEIGLLLAHGIPASGFVPALLVAPLVAVALGGALGALASGPYAQRVARGLLASSGFPAPVDAGPQPALALVLAACAATAVVTTLAAVRPILRGCPRRALEPAYASNVRRRLPAPARFATRLSRLLRLSPPVQLGLTYAARNRIATLVTALGIGFGLAQVLTTIVVHESGRAEVRATVGRWSHDATVQFRSPVGPTALDALARAADGRTEPFVSGVAYVQRDGSGAYRQVLGLPRDGLARELPIAQGRGVGDLGTDEVVVDAWLAQQDELSIGSTLLLFPSAHAPDGIEVSVAGILDGVSFGRIVLPLDAARVLFQLGNHSTGAHVASPLEPEALAARLGREASVEAAIPTAHLTAQVDADFEGREAVLWLSVVASTLMAIAFLGILAALEVVQKAPQLGILQSLGWRDVAVGGVLVTEVLVRGLLAATVAVAAAPLATRWVLGRITATHGFRLGPHEPWWIFLAVLATVWAVLPLSTLPAWWAALRVPASNLLRRLHP